MRIDLKKIICINLASLNAQQLFSICETYFIGFEALYKSKKIGVEMEWLNEDRDVVAYIFNGEFNIAEKFCSLNKKEYDGIKKIKPVKTPKIPKTDISINNYKAFLDEGYNIRTPSMDSLIIHKEKEQQEKLPVILDIDIILDKINKYGISSITEEEIRFLNNI